MQIMVNNVLRDATEEEVAAIEALRAAQAAPVPATVSRRQARQALLLRGLLDQVAPAIAAIEDPVQRGLAQIEWEDSQVFERERPLVAQIAQALSLDGTQLDELFIFASTLP